MVARGALILDVKLATHKVAKHDTTALAAQIVLVTVAFGSRPPVVVTVELDLVEVEIGIEELAHRKDGAICDGLAVRLDALLRDVLALRLPPRVAFHEHP